MMRLANLSLLLLFILCILTFLFDLYSPPDTLANLIAPSIAWSILFAATFIPVAVQIWGVKHAGPSLEALRGIEQNTVHIPVCFLLVHLCSAAANESRSSLFHYVYT